MSTPQFVAVVFQKNATRRYTYRDENTPPLQPGDKGNVETDRGTITVEVVEVVAEPSFATRLIARFDGITPAPIDAPPPAPPAEPTPRPARKGAAATKKEVRELAADISRGESPKPEGIDEQ